MAMMGEPQFHRSLLGWIEEAGELSVVQGSLVSILNTACYQLHVFSGVGFMIGVMLHFYAPAKKLPDGV